ncbi:MAG: CaiB/BaiF CoA-transferase family protein [Nocardioidaceae bacterium]
MSLGPLAGVRVVELAGIGPAPFACMLLAELGADVIKVDRPSSGFLGLPAESDLLNRGRPSVCIDLKSPAGVHTVRRLADTADVLIEGFRPGVAERLGLGPDVLLEQRPSLVYGRMTGWGQDGPWSGCAGHDIDYLALTGVLHAIGPAAAPVVPLNLVGDFGGGAMYLVVGVLAALLEARATGDGQVVDAAIVDGATHLMTQAYGLMGAGVWTDKRESNLLDGGTPFYGVFETSDDRHVAVGPLEPQFYAEFERLLGLSEPLPERTDIEEWQALRQRIADAIASRTRDEWTQVFEGSDACVAPVLSMREAPLHPHLVARSTFVEREGVAQPAPAPRFSRTATTLSTPPVSPGHDSREALLRWGIEDVDDLLTAGVVTQRSKA